MLDESSMVDIPALRCMSVLVGSILLFVGGLARAEPPRPSLVEDPMLQPPPPATRVVSSWGEAIAVVRERSSELRIAYTEIERAAGQSRVALAGLLPSVNGTGVITRNLTNKYAPQTPICDALLGTCSNSVSDQALPPTAVDGSITLTQPLVDLRAWYAYGTAKLAANVARLEVDAQKRAILVDVASAIVAVVTAERVAELSRSGLRLALERLTLAEQRKTLGGGTRLDALRVRQDVAEARVTVLAADDALKQSREAVGLALGIPGEVGVAPGVSLDGIEASIRTSCKLVGFEERPDIAAARGRQLVAARVRGDVHRQFLPRLMGQSLLAATALRVEPNPVWNVQAVLSVPIWDGGARYGLLQMADAEAERADQKLVVVTRNAEVEIARAHRAVSTAEARQAMYTESRAAAVESDELTNAAFQTGLGTSVELVLSSARRREAEINVAVGEFDVVHARIAKLVAHARCTF
jgi:outer membrane protein TolC